MPKLFIGGLAENIQEMELAIFVSLHGRVDTIKVVRDRATGKCKGYAFLEILDLADAKNIISMLDGETFKGNVVTIKISEEAPVAPKVFSRSYDASKKKRPRVSKG